MTLNEFLKAHQDIIDWETEILSTTGLKRPKDGWDIKKRINLKRRLLGKLLEYKIMQEPIDYFEFGVAGGRLLSLASHLLTDPKSRLFGFDTFTGLPEAYVVNGKELAPQGGLSQEGLSPLDRDEIYDARCTCVKGDVRDTLVEFLVTYQNRPKIIYLDLDLYEGTWYVLDKMAGLLLPGDVVVFDQFRNEELEYRAYCDYVEKYGDSLNLVGKSFNQYVFEVTESVARPNINLVDSLLEKVERILRKLERKLIRMKHN